jgi:hypothetical protein
MLPRRVWPLFRGWFARPGVSLLFAFLLAVDGCSLPRETVVGGMLAPARASCRLPPRCTYAIVRSGCGLALVEDPREVVAPIAAAHYAHWVSRHGFWAVTHRRERGMFEIHPTDAPLTLAEEAAVRRLVADAMASFGDDRWSAWADRLRAGTALVSTPVPGGWVHNGIALGLAAGLLGSLLWMKDAVVAVRLATRRERAVELGVCPECWYDLRGLTGTACPECGAATVADRRPAGT